MAKGSSCRSVRDNKKPGAKTVSVRPHRRTPPKPVLLDKAIEITKAYAQSDAVKDPSFISDFRVFFSKPMIN